MDQERKQIIIDSADNLTRAVNIIGDKEELSVEFAKALMSQHRTLQQSSWRAIFGAIKYYAENASSDLRNQDSVEACKKLAKFMEEENIYLSYV